MTIESITYLLKINLDSGQQDKHEVSVDVGIRYIPFLKTFMPHMKLSINFIQLYLRKRSNSTKFINGGKIR